MVDSTDLLDVRASVAIDLLLVPAAGLVVELVAENNSGGMVDNMVTLESEL